MTNSNDLPIFVAPPKELARLISLSPELAPEVLTLRAQAAKDKARIERLEAALSRIIIESGGKAIPNESLTVARNLAIAAAEDGE